MSGEWFIRRGDEQWGPLSQHEFQELQKRGQLREDDWVWSQALGSWRRFGQAWPPPLTQNDDIEIETDDGVRLMKPEEALAFLVEEHLQHLKIPAENRWQYQFVELLSELLRGVGSPVEEWTEWDVREAVGRASDLLENFLAACQRNDARGDDRSESSERYRCLWQHRDLMRAFRDGDESKEACPVWREDLIGVANEYLEQDLRSPKFEALLVDALLAAEAYAFGEEIKKNPTRYSRKFTFDTVVRAMDDAHQYNRAKGNLDELTWLWLKRNAKFALIKGVVLFGTPIVVAWWAIVNDREVVAISAVLFAGVIATYKTLSWFWKMLKGLFQEPPKEPIVVAFELHQKMVNAYDELKGGASSSPQRIREVLAKVADEGAVWDPVVFSLIDLAIARSSGNWGTAAPKRLSKPSARG